MRDAATTRPRVDNRIAVETPEAVEFQLELAGIGPRAGAWCIDGAVKMAVVVAAGIAALLLGTIGAPVAMLASFGVLWLYNPLFEVWNDGQTPGKAVLGVRVVHRDGTPVGWYGAIVRNLVRVVDMMPFGYVTGVVAMIVSGRFQRLGDVAGDTAVVYRRDRGADRPVERLPECEPVRISVSLEPDEQEAIVAWAARSRVLGEERSAELAAILAPLVDAPDGRRARERLQGVARRIVQWG